MPLIKSDSKKAFSQNVSEIMHSYQAKGKIGSYYPESAKKAQKIALAIAYSQKRKS